MISRYQRPVFKRLWSEKNRYQNFLKVELACAKAWQNLGLFDEDTYQKLTRAQFSLSRVRDIEKETKHDVIAFTRAISESLGDEKKWFHYGLTSTDVVDSAQSLILREVNQILWRDLHVLQQTIKKMAYRYRYTPIMGRTHGIHAEITSFGLKFALYYEDLNRISASLRLSMDRVEVIKVSGAVGNHSANHPDFQREVAQELTMEESAISTQVLQRDRHAFYLSQLALLASELEKIAVEIRHLARTEVGEVSEAFAKNQKGSSAMPHKKNPIGSENITGLSRVVRGYMITAYENIALWHERDISHSSAERIILQDATSLLDYMMRRLNQLLQDLLVHEDNMLKNIELTQGVIHAQEVLNRLIQKGFSREHAYDLVQRYAHDALQMKRPFIDYLKNDPAIGTRLSDLDYTQIFDLKRHLKYIDHIYQRVF